VWLCVGFSVLDTSQSDLREQETQGDDDKARELESVMGAFKHPPGWRTAELLRSRSMLSKSDVFNDNELVPPVGTTHSPIDAAPTWPPNSPATEPVSLPLIDGAAFLRRLRPGIGRELITIEVRDHHLEVTAKGG